ncbi:hypothetical protein P7H19_09285 [Paenibacillus larvae]|nr:hypothetical protein [Paenibacillus larvae]MDT2236449.1 hypothetical protein [Paenibacillus larvae]
MTVTTFNYKQNRPVKPEVLPILAGDSHERGTFPHFDRVGTISYPFSLGNAYISISSSLPDSGMIACRENTKKGLMLQRDRKLLTMGITVSSTVSGSRW